MHPAAFVIAQLVRRAESRRHRRTRRRHRSERPIRAVGVRVVGNPLTSVSVSLLAGGPVTVVTRVWLVPLPTLPCGRPTSIPSRCPIGVIEGGRAVGVVVAPLGVADVGPVREIDGGVVVAAVVVYSPTSDSLDMPMSPLESELEKVKAIAVGLDVPLADETSTSVPLSVQPSDQVPLTKSPRRRRTPSGCPASRRRRPR